MREEDERVPFTCGISFGNEKRVHELRRIWYKVLEFAIYGINGEDSVFADVRVAMLETRPTSGDKRFEEFYVSGDFLEEPQGRTTDIFIWMLL